MNCKERYKIKMYKDFGISEKLEELSIETEKEIKTEFEKIDKICEINSLKVLKAMQECNLSASHLNTSTGYGIDEPGRDKIEEIYSKVFKAEDALVRSQLISGSHALAITLQGLLRPGDTMLSITGLPYDTLQTIIGIGENPSPSSLKSFNINYEQIDLVDNEFDIQKIVERLSKKDIKLVEIQRSLGYSTRKSLTIDKVENTDLLTHLQEELPHRKQEQLHLQQAALHRKREQRHPQQTALRRQRDWLHLQQAPSFLPSAVHAFSGIPLPEWKYIRARKNPRFHPH